MPTSRAEHQSGSLIALSELPRLFDHTLLKPDATPAQIQKLCEEAIQFGFATVCINPCNIPQAKKLLSGSPVKVCTVIGFPLGANFTATKVEEARRCIDAGAAEVDMVINIGALVAGHDAQVGDEIGQVAEASHSASALVKVILETALLNEDQKVRGARLVKNARADFVKTSTGFASGGATVDDVRLLRATVGPSLGVKAAGGIRTYEDVQKMVAAGATRIGSSSSVKIIEEARQRQ
jgi:deoxyribose-phosphate aldolase